MTVGARRWVAPCLQGGLSTIAVLLLGCGGHSAEGSSACGSLCELRSGCGYTVETCSERCELTLQELDCRQETRALLQCLAEQSASDVQCVESGPYSSFRLRAGASSECLRPNDSAVACSCNPAAENVRCF